MQGWVTSEKKASSFSKGIFSGVNQTDAERSFMSGVIGNTFGTTSNGATQSDRQTAETQTWLKYAPVMRLRGRGKFYLAHQAVTHRRCVFSASTLYSFYALKCINL
jgi:hypothetical protein